MTCGLSDLRRAERISEGDRKPGGALVSAEGRVHTWTHTRSVMADRCVLSLCFQRGALIKICTSLGARVLPKMCWHLPFCFVCCFVFAAFRFIYFLFSADEFNSYPYNQVLLHLARPEKKKFRCTLRVKNNNFFFLCGNKHFLPPLFFGRGEFIRLSHFT